MKLYTITTHIQIFSTWKRFRNVTIAVPPTATDVPAVKAWLEKFRKRVQYD